MKKVLTIAIMALSLPLSALNLKVTAGLGLNRYSLDKDFDATTASSKTGILAGIGTCLDLGNEWQVEADLFFSQRGSKATLTDLNSTETSANYSSSMLVLPIQLKIKFLKKIKPYIVVGPEIALVLSHRVAIEGLDAPIDLKEKTSSIVFGMSAGAGVEYKLKKTIFFMELRYSAGLSNLYRKTEVESSIKTNSLQLGLGAIFDFR